MTKITPAVTINKKQEFCAIERKERIMAEIYEVKIIAKIHSDFPSKFGIPRQSGIVDSLESLIVFEPEYRNEQALRGIEDFSHLWLIWQFSKAVRDDWSPMVRPPKLGGNTRKGVFATRSPFRPNAIGLSSVRLVGVEKHPKLGHVLRVAGADLMDGTPILDIKPYLPFTDSHPEATGGFTDTLNLQPLRVCIPEIWEEKIPEDKKKALREVLENDPRPSYQDDPDRVYGFFFSDMEVKFTVSENILTVCGISKR